MIDKILEQTYIDQATAYIAEVEPGADALFLAGVQYGLDQRDSEVQALKDRITELGG